MMQLKHLSHNEIDKALWDQCIANAQNSVVYAYSWYLDTLSSHWAALVSENYEFIMPLPVKKFVGLRIVYKPFFIQKLGIFSSSEVSHSIVDLFLERVLQEYWYLDLGMQYVENLEVDNLIIKKRSNFTLDISQSYDFIASKYNVDARKSLKKSNGISVTFDNSFSIAIQNFISAYGKKSGVQLTNYSLLDKAIQKAEEKKKIIGATVYKDAQQIASGLFLIDKGRAYYVLGAPSQDGRKHNATHFLIDGFIREFAGKLKILDFEGSDIESVAYFYQKWGSVDEPYLQLSGTKHPTIKFIFWLKSYLRSIIVR